MTDEQYRIACLEADLNKMKEAVQKYMQQVDRRLEKPYDKGTALIVPYNKAKSEVNNLINPVKSVTQRAFEGL